MSAAFIQQATFSRGEISPLLLARADIEYWRSSTSLCTNFLVLRQGGLRRRSGTIFIREVKDSSKTVRLLPFVFNASQAYVLEMGDSYTRFLADRAVLGAPYEIPSPYFEADLSELHCVQSADVMYIAHGKTLPRQLRRAGDTDWTFSEVEFKDGPYLPQTVETTTNAIPSGTGDLTGSISARSTNMGTASGSLPNLDDQNLSSFWRSSNSVGYVRWDFGAGNSFAVDVVSITSDDENPDMAPATFQIQGSNDAAAWTTLRSVPEDRGWEAAETRHYDFVNETAYRYYQLNIQAPSGEMAAKKIQINEVRLKQSAATMAAVTFTLSALADVNGGDGLSSGDVGRQLRFKGTDGVWRWTKILTVSTATTFTGKIYGPALPDTDATQDWRLGSFSERTGFPTSVCFFQERLCWAGTAEQPLTLWASKSGAFGDHGVSDPLLNDDAIDITMLSSQVNQIRWIAEDEDILVGSAGSIRTIGPADRTSAFSATNVDQTRQTTYGASGINPARAGNTTVFVGRAMRNLRELLFDGSSGRYVAPDLSILSSHLFASGIVDMAWQQDPTPILWCVTGEGGLIAVTYDREQQILGFARQEIAGAQAVVESVAVIPNAAGFDDLYMVVKRTVDGAEKRYVEVLERQFDSTLTSREDGIFLDSCLTYDGPPATTITGLAHLEGEAVGVLADGKIVYGKRVSAGEITLPNAASTVHVGLKYTSKVRTLPIAGPGRDGSLFGRRRKPTACFLDLLDTGEIYVGTPGSQVERPSDPVGGERTWYSDLDLKSGVWRCDLDSSWVEDQGVVEFSTAQPLPATIRALNLQIEGEP